MALALGVRSSSSWQPESLPWNWKQRRPNRVRVRAMWGVQKPSRVELEAIENEEQFDRIVADSHSTRVVIEWMAQWCRKCIYLKPKLESLAADFHQSAKFYFVDVNTVPKALVDRAGVTKMPTIQLWRQGEKRDEVIGGHKAWLVVDEVREMIQKSP